MKLNFFGLFFFGVSYYYCICKENTDKILQQNGDMKDSKHGIKMGQIITDCDDAKVCLKLNVQLNL